MEREVERFYVEAPDGATYTVAKYQELHEVRQVGAPTEWIKGLGSVDSHRNHRTMAATVTTAR